MAGYLSSYNALESKIRKRKLAKKKRQRLYTRKPSNAPQFVSVVTYTTDAGGNETINWPDNPNPLGLLLVPEPVSIEEWEAYAASRLKRSKWPSKAF